jgi:hypothetical protein
MSEFIANWIGTTWQGKPEIVAVNFDLWCLRITLSFEDGEPPVYVMFEGVVGFRVLREGDLLEFWPGASSRSEWLWEVRSGGWFELERGRSGFVSGEISGINEYFVAGAVECVSVLASAVPKISRVEG